MDLRRSAAIHAAKATGTALRFLGRGGTALPGVVAERLAPTIVADLGRGLARGSALVTGTNGKTTTARLLAAALRAGGLVPVHNTAGSNLMRGLAATLTAAARADGRLPGGQRSVGVFEVDEAVAPLAARALRPRVVVITNLFRDQLDRYAELETVATLWRGMLGELPGATVVLNADDPLVGALPAPTGGRRLLYGITDRSVASDSPGAADSVWCPRCGGRLTFRAVWFAHLGDYHCPACGYTRPPLDLAAGCVRLGGFAGSEVRLQQHGRELVLRLQGPGVYNVSNALAALGGALAMGVPSDVAARAMAGVGAAFGRAERLTVNGREVMLLLVKNPTGANEALRTVLAEEAAPSLLLALNDRTADGRDVSWIWDVDYERLAGHHGPITVTGDRAAELALRLKYAGADDGVEVLPDVEEAVGRALARGEGRLYVLPTYTALLALHGIFARRAGAARFWERRGR
jgi:UDP-N-acetylmuramyl tripeptide synthase